MHRTSVRQQRQTRDAGAWLALALARFGVGPLVFACGVAPLSCSPAENTQPRSTHTGGTSGGSNPTTQGGTVSTGGSQATATGGNISGGQSTGGSAGGMASTGGGLSTGGTLNTGGTPSTGGMSAGQSPGGGAGGAAKGGAGGNAMGSSAGAATGGKNASGGASTAGGGSLGAAGSAGSASTAGSGGAATCPGFVFCETFEDGNITANPAWLSTMGAFTVVDDGGSKVMKQQASSEAWAYSGSATWTDMTVQARVKVLDFMGTSSTNCAGIIARWQGSGMPNYMASLCAKGTVGIYKDGDLVDEVNGSKAANVVANTWYALKFKVSGKPGSVNLVLSLDDVPVITISDTDTSNAVSAGYMAVGSKKAFSIEYDDIKVSSP